MALDTFDFDEWAALAKSTPEVFEQQRRKHVEHLISNGKDIRRLRGLQCRIDMERIRARTSMKACLRIYSLMWDSLVDFQDALDKFVYLSPSSPKISPLLTQRARIIHFPQKN